MAVTFLQGQAIYQILHILVSITQPIVKSGYFSRFIWLGRGRESFGLMRLSPKAASLRLAEEPWLGFVRIMDSGLPLSIAF